MAKKKKSDQLYLQAVAQGDLITAQKMVERAAEEASQYERKRLEKELKALDSRKVPFEAKSLSERVKVLGPAGKFPPYNKKPYSWKDAWFLLVVDPQGKKSIRIASQVYVRGKRLVTPHRFKRKGVGVPMPPFWKPIPWETVEYDAQGRVIHLSKRFGFKEPLRNPAVLRPLRNPPAGSWNIDSMASFAIEQLKGFVRSGRARDVHEAWENFGEDVLVNDIFWSVYGKEPGRAKLITEHVREKINILLIIEQRQ